MRLEIKGRAAAGIAHKFRAATETDLLGGDGDLYIVPVAAEVMLVGETSADQLSVWGEEEKIAPSVVGAEGRTGEGNGEERGQETETESVVFFQWKKKYPRREEKKRKIGTRQRESTAMNDGGGSSSSKSSNQFLRILPSPKTRLASSHFHSEQPGLTAAIIFLF